MNKLIFGCGYLGQRVARLWQEEGHHVIVVTRSANKAAELQRQGMSAVVADIAQPATLTELPDLATVLFAVGFDRTPGQSILEVYEGGVRNVLAALPANTPRVTYISTTGVYGNAAGEWVDERTPPEPRRDGGRASLAAERALAERPLGANSIILRLAGLYGPGRVPLVEQIRAGEPIAAVENGHLNLIHVEDAAAAVLSADRLAPFADGPRIYCVSDGQPVRRDEYYREVARQIGAPTVRFTAPAPDSPRAARAESDRRIRNDRMQKELGIKLKYPDYRAGLTAILSAL